MMRKCLVLSLLIGFAVLNMAVVRKTEDPIRDTQTDPILYKQKMEEEKDGKKGPLSYSVKNNPADTFLTEPPFAPEEEMTDKEKSLKSAPAGMDWWEEPVAVDQASSAEDAPVPEERVNSEGPLSGEDFSSPVEPGTLEKRGPEEDLPRDVPNGSEKEVQEPSPETSETSDDSWW